MSRARSLDCEKKKTKNFREQASNLATEEMQLSKLRGTIALNNFVLLLVV